MTEPGTELSDLLQRPDGAMSFVPPSGPLLRSIVEACVEGLIGAVPFEKNDEWRTAGRGMQVGAFARIDCDEADRIPGITAQAA